MTNSTSLAYKESGQGPVVVLIHGFCESKELWNGIQEPLSKNYRIIMPDLPGHGDSKLETDELTIEFMAEQLFDLLMDLGVERCVMVGHSLGGYVTLAFAEKYPDLLAGFCLFHSTAFEDSAEKKNNRNRTIEFIEKHGMDPFADSFVSPLFYHLNREKLKADIEFVKSICRSTSRDSVIATVKAMRDRKERISVLKKTNVPVLFISGKEDTAVALDKTLMECFIPLKYSLLVIEETGHMGMFEDKERCLKKLPEFFAECYR